MYQKLDQRRTFQISLRGALMSWKAGVWYLSLFSLLSLPAVATADEDENFIYLSAIKGVSTTQEQWLFFQIDRENSVVYKNYWPYKSEGMLKDCGRKPESPTDFVYDYLGTEAFSLITTEDRYMWRTHSDMDFYDAIHRKNLIYERGEISRYSTSKEFSLIKETAFVRVLSKAEFFEHREKAEAVCNLARELRSGKENQI